MKSRLSLAQILFFLPLFLGIVFLYGGVIFATTQQVAEIPYYQLPRRHYPTVTDLAPEAPLDDKRFASLSYGAHTFLWWNETYRTWDLDNMRQMNFHYAKQSFSWDNIQPIPDVWKWHLADEVVAETLYRGRRLVARIDSAPTWAVEPIHEADDSPFNLEAFGTYCSTLASRYKGQIEAYQIWNEPNLTREWAEQVPNPRAYVKLLKVCAEAIREADPDAIIISAGLSPTGNRDASAMPDDEYLWEMYRAGAAEYFDVLGLHAPGFALPPETSLEEARALGFDAWARFRHVEDMRAIMVANEDAHTQIALMEMGWTTDTRPDSIYAWFGVTEQVQAEYLARAYQFAAEHWRPWVGLMCVIYISKDIWTEADEQWWWAIDEPAPPPVWKAPREAYFALAGMAKISDNPEFEQDFRPKGEPVYLEPLPPRQ